MVAGIALSVGLLWVVGSLLLAVLEGIFDSYSSDPTLLAYPVVLGSLALLIAAATQPSFLVAIIWGLVVFVPVLIIVSFFD
jgi:hypothetical protein